MSKPNLTRLYERAANIASHIDFIKQTIADEEAMPTAWRRDCEHQTGFELELFNIKLAIPADTARQMFYGKLAELKAELAEVNIMLKVQE